MKETVLWLQLPHRKKPDGQGLYHTIKDLSKWIERMGRLKTGEQARLYFTLLLEVNALDIAVAEWLNFLENFHLPVMKILNSLSRRFNDGGITFDDNKLEYAELINAFCAEMSNGYKIIIDDLSDAGFISSLLGKKNLSHAISFIYFYLTRKLFYNQLHYVCCEVGDWRELNQLFRFSAHRNLLSKGFNFDFKKRQEIMPTVLTIEEQYKKIVLFSVSNPYHLSYKEMTLLWENLDQWAEHAFIIRDSSRVLKKQFPFLINSYGDKPPFAHLKQHYKRIDEDKLWGVSTKHLLNHLSKIEDSDFFTKRLKLSWSGTTDRNDKRNELIEPISFTCGLSNVSKFLSKINPTAELLQFDPEQKFSIDSSLSEVKTFQGILIDESERGFRLKLNRDDEKKIKLTISDVVLIKHSDESFQTGYLRWIRKIKGKGVECGIEHLSSMAESVLMTTEQKILKSCNDVDGEKKCSDKAHLLEGFIYSGAKESQYRSVLFTHSFIEKFYDRKQETLRIIHQTGSVNIKLTEKISDILDYSLYLFEIHDSSTVSVEDSEQAIRQQKTAKFDEMWGKI